MLALGAGRADGVPDPRGAVREVVAAAVGDAGAAVRHLRRARRGVAARHDQRRVLPDRPGDAARPGGEERDPDRRVRVAQDARGPVALGRGARGGAAALPADPDDLARVHPRRAAARVLHGRGRGRAPLGGHRRDGRHARGDVPRDLLRAVLLQADHGARSSASRARRAELKAEATHHRESWRQGHAAPGPRRRRARRVHD